MINRALLLTVLALLAISRRPASAADLPRLSLQQAQQTLAFRQHPPDHRGRTAGSLASQQVVRESRSAFFPSITANATAVDATANNTRIAAGGLNNPLILTREAEGINVSQLITDFGRTANLTASSKSRARAEEQGALATRAQVLLAVNSAYFGGLEAQSILLVAAQTVTNRQLTFDQVSELAKNNLKSGLDVSFARVDLGSSRLLLANASNDLQSAFATLSNLLGERDQRMFHLLDEPDRAAPIPDDQELVQAALRDRPDLVQLRFNREAAQRFARAEKDLHYPTVSAVGSAGVLPVHDPALRDNYAAAGANVSLPIFDGMLFSAREKEAQLRADAASETLRDAENNVIRDVRIARLNLVYAAEKLTLTADLLASANEAFDLAQARYKVGSSSIVELSQAQLNQTEAQIGEARVPAYGLPHVRDSILNFQTGRTP